MPPLRERPGDLEALCEHILEQIGQRTGLAHRELTPEAIERLRRCAWRGNVRELQNVLEKAVMLSDHARLSVAELEGIIPEEEIEPTAAAPEALLVPTGALRSHALEMAAYERQLLLRALESAQNRVEEAARLLGLGRATMYRKLRTHGLLSQ